VLHAVRHVSTAHHIRLFLQVAISRVANPKPRMNIRYRRMNSSQSGMNTWRRSRAAGPRPSNLCSETAH
jgi:hypothetical protein